MLAALGGTGVWVFPCAGVTGGLGTPEVSEHIGPSINLTEATHLTSIPGPTPGPALCEVLPLGRMRSTKIHYR